MIALNFIDDGCSLSEQEVLGYLKPGLSDGPVATAEEFAETLLEVPDERSFPTPTDRGLIALSVAPELLIKGSMEATIKAEDLACQTCGKVTGWTHENYIWCISQRCDDNHTVFTKEEWTDRAKEGAK